MRYALFLLFALSACAAGGSANYAGTITPTRGVCDPAGEATLTLRDGKIIFAPQAGTLLLHGVAAGDRLEASLPLLDANKHPYVLKLQAERRGPVIAGQYITPRCTYAAQLKAVTG